MNLAAYACDFDLATGLLLSFGVGLGVAIAQIRYEIENSDARAAGEALHPPPVLLACLTIGTLVLTLLGLDSGWRCGSFQKEWLLFLLPAGSLPVWAVSWYFTWVDRKNPQNPEAARDLP